MSSGFFQSFRNRRWRATAVNILKVVCAIHLLLEEIGGPRAVHGPSMLPTMNVAGEFILQDSITHRLKPSILQRGDLVIAISPLDPGRFICKRILGLPGDIVCVDPTGVKAPPTEHVLVPQGQLWLVGDNARWSRDSRDYGPVPFALIKGRPVARIWPWRDRTIFRRSFTFLDEDEP